MTKLDEDTKFTFSAIANLKIEWTCLNCKKECKRDYGFHNLKTEVYWSNCPHCNHEIKYFVVKPNVTVVG